MPNIDQVLENNIDGLFYGNRVLLPFVADILKVSIEKDLITDFSSKKSGAEYIKHDYWTEIYFHDYDDLLRYVSRYEVIKMIVVEEGDNIFDKSKHRKIALDPKENHIIKIEEINEDRSFIE